MRTLDVCGVFAVCFLCVCAILPYSLRHSCHIFVRHVTCPSTTCIQVHKLVLMSTNDMVTTWIHVHRRVRKHMYVDTCIDVCTYVDMYVFHVHRLSVDVWTYVDRYIGMYTYVDIYVLHVYRPSVDVWTYVDRCEHVAMCTRPQTVCGHVNICGQVYRHVYIRGYICVTRPQTVYGRVYICGQVYMSVDGSGNTQEVTHRNKSRHN